MPLSKEPFAALPDPARAGRPDDLVEHLRRLKVWAGNPSYETIKDRVNTAWTAAGRPAGELVCKSTIAYCFRPGRRRLDTDLVLAVVQALHPDTGYVTLWRQALRVLGGEIEAVSQVRVQDALPQDPGGFIGRAHELDRIRHAARNRDAVVIAAIEGMPGVGKTQLAVHAGHRLLRDRAFERVLFVNLRGFDPDPAQPPADPAAVLDGFLRLLGMSGQQIPHSLDGRAAAYRDRLAATRTLVVLDNAADTGQIRPLLPGTPGCLALVTSRRSLPDLPATIHLSVDAFTPDEAVAYLKQAVSTVPAGHDPRAAARIARRCGHLPLALSLITGHIHNSPGWTLTDHADRLDERHHDRRLDTGVAFALGLSYQRLSGDQRRLLRLLAQHPGQDFDGYAAAALAGDDPQTARTHLRCLHSDHLLQQVAPGRYAFHDLVRAFAALKAHDEDRPPERRAALIRLFDHYLAAAAAAVDGLYPTGPHPRPAGPDAALGWLEAERPTLIAIAAHGWATYTIRLSATLHRYLISGHYTDAVIVHGHAYDAACRTGDRSVLAVARTDLGVALAKVGRHRPATEHLERALALFEQAGDLGGQARALNALGAMAHDACRFRAATDSITQALTLYRRVGDRNGEAHALIGLGAVGTLLGRHQQAVDNFERALSLCRQTGDTDGEAHALMSLGEAEVRSEQYGPAADHLRQALTMYRRLRNRTGEGAALNGLGVLHTLLGRPAQAAEHHRQALSICRETGFRAGEARSLNGLGEAAHPADAITHHTAAHTIAAEFGVRDQHARAHTGLGHAHRALGDTALAGEHFQHALALYTVLGLPEAGEIRDVVITQADMSHS